MRTVMRTVFLVAALLLGLLTPHAGHADTTARTFRSVNEAVSALVSAVRSSQHDRMLAVLGPAAADLVSSGDPVADRSGRERFLRAWRERHVVTLRSNGTVVLQLGYDNWAFPIPLVKEGGGWRFDTAAGHDEIIDRRIGANELRAIEVCQSYLDAQREYARLDRNGDGVNDYATKLFSTPGQHDGLYWPVKAGEALSPMGPLVAQSEHEGYTPQHRTGHGYHGYHFRVLTRQGSHAAGGAFDYVINGHMVAGYALVAWPVVYGETGRMTFIVNSHGIIYQKDLGPTTDEAARAMVEYDPDESWKQL